MERPQAVRTRTRRRVAALGSLAVVLLLLAAAVAAPAQAAPGDLDLTFSGDGKQTTDFGFGLSSAAATVRQPDGKIVAVGTDRGRGTLAFALARYNPNGSLDTSFSGDGKQRTEFVEGLAEAAGVALQGNGKIVVVGHALPAGFSQYDFALARYNPDGSLDTSFSGDGKQTTDFGGFDDGAAGVAIQGDGKIVAVGFANTGSTLRLRARPLQPERLARHELLRRWQADDRLRGLRRRWGERGGATGRRKDRRGRPRCLRHGRPGLRARPLQPERLARHELLRRRQADDRLRGLRPGERGGAPG